MSRMADGRSGASQGAAAPPEMPLCPCLPFTKPCTSQQEDTPAWQPPNPHTSSSSQKPTHRPNKRALSLCPRAPCPGLSPHRELGKWHPASCYVPLVTTGPGCRAASLPASPDLLGSPLPWQALLGSLARTRAAVGASLFGAPPSPQPAAGGWWPGPLGQLVLALLALAAWPGSCWLGAALLGSAQSAWKATRQLWVWVVRREREVEGKLSGRLAGVVACPQEEKEEEEKEEEEEEKEEEEKEKKEEEEGTSA